LWCFTAGYINHGIIAGLKKKFRNIVKDADSREILVKGFAFLSIRSAGLLAGYFFTYFVAKYYGASVYGLVALSFSLFVIAGMLGRLGLDINIVKFYSEDHNWSNKGLFYRVLIKSFLVSSLLAAGLYYSKDLIANRLFSKPALEPYIYWVALSVPFWSITLICAGLLRAKGKNGWFAILNNPGRFFFALLFVLILWAFTDDPLTAIKGHFYGIAGLAVMALLISIYHLRSVSFSSDANSWAFLKESIPMMLSSTILVILGWMDTFVLGIYETDANIGIYNVALKIATFSTFSLQAINSILAPKIARSYASDDKVLFQRVIRFGARINFFSTLVIVLGIILGQKWILQFFGDDFVNGTPVLIILCIGQVISSMSGSVGVILQMTGKQGVYQNIMLVALILNLVLNFSLTPVYGNFGAAVATVVSIAAWNLIGAIYLKRNMNIVSYYDFK